MINFVLSLFRKQKKYSILTVRYIISKIIVETYSKKDVDMILNNLLTNKKHEDLINKRFIISSIKEKLYLCSKQNEKRTKEAFERFLKD